ncbi:hypothetical protein yc1106_05277 [Curvularia clavata]|uniref:Uncharacterized protein n=1 Tax=Curvularia clavata TaxID=95742 RepID=A0A9Q8ZCY0_CURCL|nr:hypothetical protein yc1106_05277 [Curvularia clavata]
MRFSAFLIGSVAPTLIAAHGKVAVVQGDAGGNGTAIGIQGGIIPGAGKNKVTEPDTTVFGSTKIATDGLGKTNGQGKNTVAMVADTMAQSGSTLPQVSDGGMITGTFHIVTTDGAGPVSAMIDPTGTGAFSNGVQATVVQDVPGNKGNIKANGQVPRSLGYWALQARSLVKRAANVNQDFPIAVQVPAGTTCSGTAAGQQNVCFMKIANSNRAGPFGGVIAFQMAGAAAGKATAGAGAGTTGSAAGSTTGSTTGSSGTGSTTSTGSTAGGASTVTSSTKGTGAGSSSSTSSRTSSTTGNTNGKGAAGTAGTGSTSTSNTGSSVAMRFVA